MLSENEEQKVRRQKREMNAAILDAACVEIRKLDAFLKSSLYRTVVYYNGRFPYIFLDGENINGHVLYITKCNNPPSFGIKIEVFKIDGTLVCNESEFPGMENGLCSEVVKGLRYKGILYTVMFGSGDNRVEVERCKSFITYVLAKYSTTYNSTRVRIKNLLN